ncbi:BofC C-terminal domain-containing protein [Sporohalobacter salinus]|uniref:BofC C-terminal domain-containing protein n=1 Tax=Sporohalobacter salinus TaxID=1494606 RepID=UPI001961581F|nr:BofC C-terminal domain-containing protein [Sporohalobacter salinus]MBM7623205.1 hypothetical protein [Sporohalobacter salinus]
MFSKKKIILISLVLFILTSIFVYFGLNLYDSNESTPKENNEKIESKAKKDLKQSQQNFSQLIEDKKKEFETKLELAEEQFQTSLNPVLIFKTHYTRCGDIIVERQKIKNEFKINNLITKYSQWKLVKKNKQKIILERRVDKVCPEHKEGLYLGIKGGIVAIFYGTPDEDKRILKRKTNISIDLLPSREIKKLKEGIIVDSQKELLTILEGLGSIQDEQFE